MRLTLQHLGKGVTLINDAYNANPESMTGALLTLRDYPAPARRVAILGDMLELGDTSADLHLQLIEEAEYLVSTIILIGPRMAAADSRGAAAHTIDNWSDQTPDRVAAWLRPRDTVLLKASRGMKLERLIPAFEKRFGPAKRHRRVFSLLSSWYKSGR
jgi:UDP-N-acetylmuramyl pentapeptide synthase